MEEEKRLRRMLAGLTALLCLAVGLCGALHLREAGIMESDAAGRVWQAVQEHGNAALGTHAEVDAAKTERIVRAACG